MIHIESHSLSKRDSFPISPDQKIAVISDTHVAPLYAEPLANILDAELFTVPAGEASKTREMKQHLEDQLLERNYGRNTTIIAVGGGVVLDLVGFLASTYCRGVPYQSCPTTLLAMVDACYGGKTGVNTPHGKNLIGAFYSPEKILIDPTVLSSLPQRELHAAYAEIIKYACIDENFPRSELLANEPLLLIELSLQSKKHIVTQDPYDQTGLRASLNFGHTLAHALESLSSYDGLHGEAVAIGICFALDLSEELCRLPKSASQEIKTLLHRFALPTQIPLEFSPEQILEKLHYDKKKSQKEVSFVLLSDIGKPRVVALSDSIILDHLKAVQMCGINHP